jgi:hypothetical protein
MAGAKTIVVTPEMKAALERARKVIPSLIKLQARVRGHLARKRKNRQGKQGELEMKMSQRSGQDRFKVRLQDKNQSMRNGLVYAKQLVDMPDYSNEATRLVE